MHTKQAGRRVSVSNLRGEINLPTNDKREGVKVDTRTNACALYRMYAYIVYVIVLLMCL